MTQINPIKILSLNDLRENKPERPGWSLTFGAICADAAAVCLDERGHSMPVMLTVEGLETCEIQIQGDAIDDTIRRFRADREVATEYGAYGITALIMPHLTGLTIIERSVKSKDLGFDFWLGSLADSATLFQRKARLEVSGIRQGSDSLIQTRVNIKLEQIRPSDDVAPGYVSVVEFGTPKARVVKKCR
ncbi:hypothetical protein C7B67_18280 [filamentous cyanobacterium Phorm 6]|nr:hypothetical protein C7B67_18280 [filamentous cyanobacterium Phorm 6]